MRTISAEHAERIDAVMAERDVGGLTAAIFEKDIHVTESLACLFAEPVSHDASLIFCGGTSLSKGHGVIARMSEDIDIKVQLEGHLSGGQQTKAMKAVFEVVAGCLSSAGFEPADDQWLTKADQSRQITMRWRYLPRYAQALALRPELQIELRLSTLRRPATTRPIWRMVDQFVGDTPNPLIQVPCQNIAETLAEKVMAWLRRRADEIRDPASAKPSDRTLARHLHDVHAISHRHPGAVDKAVNLFAEVLQEERASYGRSFADAASPVSALQAALQSLDESDRHRRDYDLHVVPMLFSNPNPAFDDVLNTFRDIATRCLLAANQP
jgi:hypothetical protein